MASKFSLEPGLLHNIPATELRVETCPARDLTKFRTAYPFQRLVQRFRCHAHVMRVGVQQKVWPRDNSHMPLPEDQVATLGQLSRVEGPAQ